MKPNKGHKFIIACIVLALAVIGVVLYSVLPRDDADYEAQAAGIEETIQERALQCYVIENAYPESLEYLEENYGLTVNKEDFQIIYKPYAENLPPDIRVVHREDEQ